jgi:hypothetical protein
LNSSVILAAAIGTTIRASVLGDLPQWLLTVEDEKKIREADGQANLGYGSLSRGSGADIFRTGSSTTSHGRVRLASRHDNARRQTTSTAATEIRWVD